MLVQTLKKGVWARGLMTASLVAVAAFSLPATAQQPQQPPALVEVDAARSAMMAPQTFVPGTVVSRNDSRIASEINGQVTWVAAEGSLVKQGEPIARIDDRNLKLQLERNKSQVKRLEARLAYLKSDLERLRQLAAQNNTPVNRLEEAESTAMMTEQELEQARVEVRQTETDLDRTTVRAPFPGRVAVRLAQIGEYATPGRQIVRLVDTEHLEVAAQAPVSLARILADGQSVTLRHDQNVLETKIRALIPVGDTVSRTMEIRVGLPEGHFVVGSAVQIGLSAQAPEEVVAVPRDALVLRREGTYVFRVKDDNTAERLVVTTGAATGDLVAVSGGIENGDRVVVRGGERLRPGQPVQLREAEAAVARGSSGGASGR
ncbi:MAG: efflux RND transporter periplasmic adaptor subunit [Alphaproteobacteria bacterium]|nr:MAG: efflux RND transporter periplasmic adaptor subunit [Alphaproteobacteria bacterium]